MPRQKLTEDFPSDYAAAPSRFEGFQGYEHLLPPRQQQPANVIPTAPQPEPARVDMSRPGYDEKQPLDPALVREDVDGWADTIAPKYDIPPDLVKSVIEVESSYRPEVIYGPVTSSKGARGAMQIMPANIEWLKEKIGRKELNLLNPEDNIEAGTWMLSWLLKEFDGDLDKALAGYNWGIGNVRNKGMDKMPEETKNYIDKVNTSMLLKAKADMERTSRESLPYTPLEEPVGASPLAGANLYQR